MAEFENHIKPHIPTENLLDAVKLPTLGVLCRNLRYNS